MSSSVRWAILGTSPISEVMAQAIQETSSLVAIYSRSECRASAFAKKYNIPKKYTDANLLFSDPEIDAVYIGLPNHLHKEWAIRSAQAGKHILCEKPLAPSAEDVKAIYNETKKANVFCMEALMYRCHPFTVKLHELIKTNVVGDIKFINAHYSVNILDVVNPTLGGAILNLGCYPISLIRLLLASEPVEMQALGILDNNKNDKQASAVLRFANNAIVNVFTSLEMGFYFQFDIYGTEGYIKAVTNPWLPTLMENKLLIYKNNKDIPTEIEIKADKSLYAYQIELTNQHIKTGCNLAASPGVSWEDSLGNAKVLQSWRQQVQMHENKNRVCKLQ